MDERQNKAIQINLSNYEKHKQQGIVELIVVAGTVLFVKQTFNPEDGSKTDSPLVIPLSSKTIQTNIDKVNESITDLGKEVNRLEKLKADVEALEII